MEPLAPTPPDLLVNLILPVPLVGYFTYRVNNNEVRLAQVGARAVVPFGRNRLLTGIIVEVGVQAKPNIEPKNISLIIDEPPTCTAQQITFWQWMADYYCCRIGEVMQAALPAALKPDSETRLQLNPAYNSDPNKHTGTVAELISQLTKKSYLPLESAIKILGSRNPIAEINQLERSGVIVLFKEVKDKYSPKTKRMLRLTHLLANDKKLLEAAFDQLTKKPKQAEALMFYLREVPVLSDANSNLLGLEAKTFEAKKISASAIKALIQSKIFEEFRIIEPRFKVALASQPMPVLSQPQQEAFNQINASFEEKKPALLFGVTGSGKTEVYLHAIKQAVDAGGQVLMLVPEIALTAQMVGRLSQVLGQVGVYHSKFSDAERVEVWRGVGSGQIRFVLGARSAIFLPYQNLKLIIIDEEHEGSYKQQDPAPRYNARDAALYLANNMGAQVILGSATPSAEAYYQALNKKFTMVKLTSRFNQSAMPKVGLIDLKEERRNDRMTEDLSMVLLEQIRTTIEAKQQVILFRNRRGFAPRVECNDCAHIPQCPNCNVALTLHQRSELLRCHYCGYKTDQPSACPECGSIEILPKGFGTQKIEETLANLLPQAITDRMDADTTRNRNAHQIIINRFEEQETHILVGTQMVTKGLDFENVSLVGVFDADNMLFFPDFRAEERTCQTLIQVIGRAGRGSVMGSALIQTIAPNHPVFETIISGNYEGFINKVLADRQKFGYPPFSRGIKILFKHIAYDISSEASDWFALKLKKSIAENLILGPQPPLINRIRNMYIFEIFIKIPKGSYNLTKIKEYLTTLATLAITQKKFSGLKIIIDVDPN